MPLWIKITIIILAGGGLAVGAYNFVDLKLDQEHERYIQNIVVQYSKPTKESEETTTNQEKDLTNEENTNQEKETQTEEQEKALEILTQGQSSPTNDPQKDLQSPKRELSIEIGSITLDEVDFKVGESWNSEDSTETYTITKIVQKIQKVELYYETKDGAEYVFVLDKTKDDQYVVDGAPEITLSVNTDPEETGQDLAGQNLITDQAPTSTDSGTETTNTSNTDTTNQTSNTNSQTPNTADPVYVVVDASATTTDETGDDSDGNNTNTDNSSPDDSSETNQNNTATSTAPTSTEPIIVTTPPEQTNSPQPYNDGTYQYKANPQFVPYTPPLYDRDQGENISIDS